MPLAREATRTSPSVDGGRSNVVVFAKRATKANEIKYDAVARREPATSVIGLGRARAGERLRGRHERLATSPPVIAATLAR